jgi:hypothetical protein
MVSVLDAARREAQKRERIGGAAPLWYGSAVHISHYVFEGGSDATQSRKTPNSATNFVSPYSYCVRCLLTALATRLVFDFMKYSINCGESQNTFSDAMPLLECGRNGR